ncbi:MAG: winged helix-turn-helix transcriptional regulator [Candidatus Heimdallarchaeota archaeon]|nr:winged helix-turn-helix transcriptional regulator [Candidatus Heimdallarchaeota archaeon]
MNFLSDNLEKRTAEILKILSDPTRRKIISIITQEPKNPQELASLLNISRPAIEKHLKLMSSQYVTERTVEPFPSPHYVYYVSTPGLDLLNAISTAIVIYFQSMDGIINAEIEQIERDFILQRISRNEYESRHESLKQKQIDLADLQLTRIWIEEAKEMIAKHERDS